MSVETVYERLYGWLVQVTEIRCGLSWFVAHHEGLRVDQPKGIDDNFALDGLYWIDNDSNGTWGELFKRLLGIDIDGRQPAAKARM